MDMQSRGHWSGTHRGSERGGDPSRRRTRMAELESKHLAWTEIKGTAQNRVRWRALVEDLCSTGIEEE